MFSESIGLMFKQGIHVDVINLTSADTKKHSLALQRERSFKRRTAEMHRCHAQVLKTDNLAKRIKVLKC